MRHTSGQWEVVAPNPPELWDARIFSGSRFIAMVGNSDNSDGCDLANARLIASSPKLLAACKKALNFIENTEGELEITLGSGDALRAAISEAKGE
jgi:hypothetical protein